MVDELLICGLLLTVDVEGIDLVCFNNSLILALKSHWIRFDTKASFDTHSAHYCWKTDSQAYLYVLPFFRWPFAYDLSQSLFNLQHNLSPLLIVITIKVPSIISTHYSIPFSSSNSSTQISQTGRKEEERQQC